MWHWDCFAFVAANQGSQTIQPRPSWCISLCRTSFFRWLWNVREKIMICNCQPPKLYCPVNSTGTATVDMVPFAVLVEFRHKIRSLLISMLSCSVPCWLPQEYSTWSSWLVPANFRVCRNLWCLMWNQRSRTGKLQGFVSFAIKISVLDKVMRWRVEAHCWIKLLGSHMSLALI